jgi:hypothetical protein
MPLPKSPALELPYDIIIEDADGRDLCLESMRDLAFAHARLSILATQYPGSRLFLRNRLTQVVVAKSDS